MTTSASGSGRNLEGVPGLGGLYLRGAARSARLGAGRGLARLGVGQGGTVPIGALPARRLTVGGIRPDADHLTAYQHLIGEPGTDVLPAGFVHVLTFPLTTALMVEPDFPLPLLGMVHLANRVSQHRPVLLGEVLDVEVHAERLAPHRSGVTADLVAQARVGAEVVWHGVSTYLATGLRLAGAQPRAEVRSAWSAPEPTGQWRLATEVARAYAAVSGDRNPIHTSTLAARAFGFRRTIAHGMFTASRALADVGAARGGAFTWDVAFARPVLLPGTVTVRVAVEDGGVAVTGWDASSGRRHLDVSVRPLGASGRTARP